MMSEVDARAKGRNLFQQISWEVDNVIEIDEEYAAEALKKIQDICKKLDTLIPDWMIQNQEELKD
nr:MAG TPA: hypothetical protein [Caudoviricetes sp.]